MKIAMDKYYTTKEVVDFCLNELKKVLKEDGIAPSRVIEPSAGNGAFSKKIKNCIAYDIEPEDNSIIKADFLNLDIQYLQGTIVVGNPPFGVKLNLARQFYNKSIEIADADYDIRFCYWGNGSAGKILAENKSSCAIYKIKIAEQFKERVINVLKTTDWNNELKFIAMKRISMDQIYLLLKREIPDIY